MLRLLHFVPVRLAAIVPLLLASCSGAPMPPSNSTEANANADAVRTARGGGARAHHHGTDANADAERTRANIIFVLTDDLSSNLVRFMPHVVDMQQHGMTFTNYFVSNSLCCPSRSSIFTGKFPHNTGIFTNDAPDGGYAAFEAAGHPKATFATLLQAAGYRTGMMGKFLNGYQPGKNAPDPSWTHWAVAGNAYPSFNYNLNVDGEIVHHGAADSDYVTDVLADLGTRFVRRGSGPFILEIATFAPHGPFKPAPRDEGTFHEQLPRTPAFARPNTNAPRWLANHPPLTDAQIKTLDHRFNLRVESVQAVDKLIGAIQQTLVATGHDRRTYIVFSSDNGFHMGEHGLFAGKMTAFDTDINVPLIVVGPGVPAGARSDAIVQNVDLCATFAEIAGLDPPPNADGHSLLALWHGQQASDWRDFAFIEHRLDRPMDSNDPDNEPDNESEARAVPAYHALRTARALFVAYPDGEIEHYDVERDPLQMTNNAGTLTKAQVRTFRDALSAARTCRGASDCWRAQKLPR